MRNTPTPAAITQDVFLASDQELIQRVLAGEKDHYAMLIRRYQDRLYRHALGMVGDADTAADLVQDSFIRSYENLGRCRDPAHFGTWIFRILRNRCLDYLKESRRADARIDDHLNILCQSRGPEADLEDRLLRARLESALGHLSDLQREAFLLKHVHGLSYEEMIPLAGASESALRMRVMRARELLRSVLADQTHRGSGNS